MPIDIAEAYNSLYTATVNVTETELCYNSTSGVEVCVVTNRTENEIAGPTKAPLPSLPPGGAGATPLPADDPWAPPPVDDPGARRLSLFDGGKHEQQDNGEDNGFWSASSRGLISMNAEPSYHFPSPSKTHRNQRISRRVVERTVDLRSYQKDTPADFFAASRRLGYTFARNMGSALYEAYDSLSWEKISFKALAGLENENEDHHDHHPERDAFGGHARFLQSGAKNGTGTGNSTIPTNNNSTTNGTVVDVETSWEVIEEEVQIRNGPLERLWMAVYVLTFLLTYIIIPVVQEYINAGDFTKCQRLRTSLKINIVFYGILGLIGAGALLYVIIVKGYDLWELVPVLISLANTYGLVLIVLMMGYGAAEVPKGIWRRSNPETELRRVQFKAPEVEANLFDAKTNLNEVVGKVKQLDREVKAMANEPDNKPGGADHEAYQNLRRCMDLVMSKCAFELANNTYSAIATDPEEEAKFAKKAAKKKWSKVQTVLARLAFAHKALMVAKRRLARHSFRWKRHVVYAVQLEHVVAKTIPPIVSVSTKDAAGFYDGRRPEDDANANGHQANNAIAATYSALACLPNALGSAVNSSIWYYRIHFAPYCDKLLAVIAETLSLLLMWSEATIWINLSGLVKPNLSVFGQLLWAVSESSTHDYFSIQVVAAIPLAWMCVCSTYAMFKLKFFDILDLSPHRNTDPYALCINAAFFNRLQFSLAFNYLNVLMHSNNKADFPDTAFSHSVGAGMKLSLIDWYLPILMPVFYIMARVDLWERFMRLLGVEEKATVPIKGNAAHEDIIQDGIKLIAKARRSMGLGEGIVGHSTPLSEDGIIRRKDRPNEDGGWMSKLRGGPQGHTPVSTSSSPGDVELGSAGYPPGHKPANSRFMSLDAFSGPSSTQNGGAGGAGENPSGPGGAAPSFFGAFTSAASSGMGAMMSFAGGKGGASGAGGAGAGGRGGAGGSGAGGAGGIDEAYIANPWGSSAGSSSSSSSWASSSFSSFNPPPASSSSTFSSSLAAPPGISTVSTPAKPSASVGLSAFTSTPAADLTSPSKKDLAALLKGGRNAKF